MSPRGSRFPVALENVSSQDLTLSLAILLQQAMVCSPQDPDYDYAGLSVTAGTEHHCTFMASAGTRGVPPGGLRPQSGLT